MTDSALDDDITVIRAEGSGGGADTPAAGWKGTIAVDMDDVLWCVRLVIAGVGLIRQPDEQDNRGQCVALLGRNDGES